MLKQKQKLYDPNIFPSITLAITAILQGQEVVLVKYKKPLHISIPSRIIASELEVDFLNVPEINQFADICYGKNWKLRPCPIFTSKPHTIISKNIAMNLGLDKEQKFEFKLDSTRYAKTQELMFKLKPNHKLTDANHIAYYNRYDGVICIEDTTHVVHYNAEEYLLIYAPLLVIHKRVDMLPHTANICFETFNYTKLLNVILKDKKLSIRDYDLFAARTGQLGILTHHGHPNPFFIEDEKNVTPSQLQPISPRISSRYETSAKKNDDDEDTSILSGTFFNLFPSFLFRRNWFTCLGNQREQGAWNGACSLWIKNSSLNMKMQEFLLEAWVPALYHNNAHSGITQQALNRRQMKFVIMNMKLLTEKLNDILDVITIEDDFLPSDSWKKLLNRRVKNYKYEKEEKESRIKNKNEKNNEHKITKRDFQILPHHLKEDVTKSEEWLKRIEENIPSLTSSSKSSYETMSLPEFKKELDTVHISLLSLDTFKQLLQSELNNLE